MEIKTVTGNEYEETGALLQRLAVETEACMTAVGVRTDAGDLTELKARLNEIRLLAESLLTESGAYSETLLRQKSVLDAYSRLSIK